MGLPIKLMNVVLSYPHLFAPRSVMGGKPKYSATLLLDIGEHAQAIHQIAEARKEIIASEFNNVVPPRSLPLKKGADKYPDKEFYANKLILNANADSKRKPFCVDQNVEPIMDEDQVYPGCIVNAVIDVFAYKMKGADGMSFGLTGIQLVRDGERLDNRPDVEEVFDRIDTPGFEPESPTHGDDMADMLG